ncbi:hypothetical protein OIU84_009621 [Salix udensis]|uniref:Uncharacterized protein n=1 Tax=Salix udensis TaxID=889485 RepID=A0AAD6NZ02_9ROSI|nr:hypothetical protein OIU84_009621 [Salix udensis]
MIQDMWKGMVNTPGTRQSKITGAYNHDVMNFFTFCLSFFLVERKFH